jgi:hypothetical protein
VGIDTESRLSRGKLAGQAVLDVLYSYLLSKVPRLYADSGDFSTEPVRFHTLYILGFKSQPAASGVEQ